jgi:hypothetical protein
MLIRLSAVLVAALTLLSSASTSPGIAPAQATSGGYPKRAAIMIASDAWQGDDPADASLKLDFALFHSPTPWGPDWDARLQFEAADSTSESFAYMNFGMACVDPLWDTCGFSEAKARLGGLLARYHGEEAHPNGFPMLTSIDMGRPGYGVAWAEVAYDRLRAGTPVVGNEGWEGIYLDDVNIADARLPLGDPSNQRGVPDGYANSIAYKNAVKVQFEAAVAFMGARGYKTQANIGGLSEAGPEFQPADDMVGLADYSLMEFCGTWSNAMPQYEAVWKRLLAAAQLSAQRGKTFWCSTTIGNQPYETKARFADHLARIVTEVGYGAASTPVDGNYQGPIPWCPFFASDHGLPTEPPHRAGAHFWRKFSDGVTLHADASNLTGWQEPPLPMPPPVCS